MENLEKDIIDYIGSKIESTRNRVIWIPMMDGETTTLIGPLKQLIVKALKQREPFDYVIEITAQPPKEVGTNYTHAKEQRMIAEKLHMLDEEDGALRRLLESRDSRDELDYYEYLDDHDGVEQRGLLPELAEKIYEKLRDKKYLLVFEHLDRPIEKTLLTAEIGLPTPLPYNRYWWLISTLSDGICSASKSAVDLVLNEENLKIAAFENHLLRIEAQDILSTISLISDRESADKILDCLFYSLMFTTPRTQVQDHEYGIKEDELVRFWMEEGFISQLMAGTDTTSRIINQKEEGEEEYDYNASHLFDIGKAIMDKFITRSLLHRRHPFIIPTDAITSLYFRIHLFNNLYYYNKNKWFFWQYKSKETSYQGWDSDWNDKKHIFLFQLKWAGFPLSPPRCRKLTTLILRGCSHMHNIPDDFFQYMPLLRILDLSYTDLSFIPSSVSYLHDLRLLTLRGCQKLTNLLPSCSQPLSSPSSSSVSLASPEHHPLLNLHVLDVSYTNIVSSSTTLYMPNLTDFLLDGCTALLDPPPFLPLLNKLRVLRLTGTQITTFPESTFSCMEWLRVLDLSDNHHLVSLPQSLSKARLLEELHIDSCKALKEINEIGSAKFHTFSLSDNYSMTSLPESLAKIATLEKVHLQDCRALKGIDAVGGTKIRILSLTNIPFLTSLPDSLSKVDSLDELHITDCRALKGIDAIGGTKIRILSLTNIPFLTSLPDSLSKVDSLEELHITDCRSLMKIEAVDGTKLKIFSLLNNDNLTSLPEWFSRAENLEKLHLQNCRAMDKINIADNASMRSFFLSGSPIIELSLRGCKNLETVELHELEELEVLDLSFTRISELPANIFNDLPKLRYFCMVAAQNLRRFPWHQIEHLPKEFIFDHCSCHVEELNGQINIRRLDGDNKAGAHIFVDDPRFFWSLKKEDCKRLIGEYQVRRHLLEFHVTISPCERRCNKEEAIAVAEASSSYRFIERRNFPYKDIYFKRSELMREVEQHRPNARLCRHLTMEGVDRWLPAGGDFYFRLLDNIDSLSISEDRSVVSLSDMSPMNTLKECILTQCHNMESVVISKKEDQQEVLEMLWVSGLGKLTTLFLVEPGYSFWKSEFGSLKHVHIEHCPRLEKLFPNDRGLLPSLETLTIKFCDSLREITYEWRSESPLYPRLHTLILLELPKLLHFYGGGGKEDAKLPSLKMLHVRGCWRLRRLPLLLLEGHGDVHVEVSGELKWWKKLTWDHYRDDEYGNLPTFKEDLIGGGTSDDHHLPREVVVSGEKMWWRNTYRYSIRFKPQAKFYSWEPSIRGRRRRRRNRSKQQRKDAELQPR